ncbi:MAG: HD domain-containing protein [bacterium]|nr:HD domain-containing protein [bacterium]
MDEIHKFRVFNKLKSVYRDATVDARKESTPEHVWSALMLADFFLSQIQQPIDRLRVYELLMYHDVVEIEAGDSPMHPSNNFPDKKEREERAFHSLRKQIPVVMRDKWAELFDEFENSRTVEARFAHAIDYLDAVIYELDHREDWKGWTKEFLVGKRIKNFEEFPDLLKAFESIVEYLEANKYFSE